AGVPDERPSGAERLAEVSRDAGDATPVLLAPRAVEPLSEAGNLVVHTPQAALDVCPLLLEHAARKRDGHERQAVVRREVCRALMRPDVLLEVIDIHAAEVAVEVGGEWRDAVVLRRFHLLRNRRVDPVGANDDLRPLFNRRAVPRVAANSGNAVAVPDRVLQRELF